MDVQKFNLILSKIESGSSLRQSLKDEGMSSKTFYEWIKDEELRKQYAHACEERENFLLDEIIKISDDGSNDFMTVTKGDMEYNVVNPEVVQRSRLRVDVRKWALSKMNPKKYGDKIIHSGDEDAPIHISFED